MCKSTLMELREDGAIPSFCVANPFVITAVLNHYLHKDVKHVLFEATSNQVNHLGGYTGMSPLEYKNMVLGLAKTMNFPLNKILFGGDHLGPLPFKNLKEEDAMREAERTVESYVLAGYEKIHIDTSMLLGDEKVLSKTTVTKRGSRLILVAERAFNEYKKIFPSAIHPVYVIGSEVPPAGGKARDDKTLEITSYNEVLEILDSYKEEFKKKNLSHIWDYVLGVVIQPGVEFGNSEVDHFISDNVDERIKEFRTEGICFEAHSTDYQSKAELCELVSNNFVILKVGPALTKSLTEALLKLDCLSSQLGVMSISNKSFTSTLREAMLHQPKNWDKYYESDDDKVLLYSLLDRSRYYLSSPEVELSIRTLLSSFGSRISEAVPAGLLRYYFPTQFQRLVWEEVSARDIVNDYISCQIEDYDVACKHTKGFDDESC